MPEQRTKKNDVNENPDRVERFVPSHPYKESANNIHREHKNAKKQKEEERQQREQRK